MCFECTINTLLGHSNGKIGTYIPNPIIKDQAAALEQVGACGGVVSGTAEMPGVAELVLCDRCSRERQTQRRWGGLHLV